MALAAAYCYSCWSGVPRCGIGSKAHVLLLCQQPLSPTTQNPYLPCSCFLSAGLGVDALPVSMVGHKQQAWGAAAGRMGTVSPSALTACAAARPSSAGAAAPAWAGLWGSSVSGINGPGQCLQDCLLEAAAADGSYLLDRLLAPSVVAAALHPTLGCVAVQLAPPLALRQAARVMQQQLGAISAPEAAISRRTASLPLLRLVRPGAADASWPGAAVAAMHTPTSFWQTASGCVLVCARCIAAEGGRKEGRQAGREAGRGGVPLLEALTCQWLRHLWAIYSRAGGVIRLCMQRCCYHSAHSSLHTPPPHRTRTFICSWQAGRSNAAVSLPPLLPLCRQAMQVQPCQQAQRAAAGSDATAGWRW